MTEFLEYLFELSWNKEEVFFYVLWICDLLNVEENEGIKLFSYVTSDKIKLSLIHYYL